MNTTTIGNLGSPWIATVDERGVVRTRECTLDWWIGAEDRWHFASSEPAGRMRQTRIESTPVVETAIRVPGGEAVLRAYATVAEGQDLVIADIENASKVPFAVAFAASGRRHQLLLPRPPSRTDAPDDAPAADRVCVYPVPHTARLRVGVPLTRQRTLPATLPPVPSPADVARGWVTHRSRGVRVVVPDDALQREIDFALCMALLDPAGRHDEWQSALWTDDAKSVTVLPALPDEWLGQGVEVHDAPTRHGRLSYAVRWHGARPALLWDLDAGRPVEVTAPALDPSWSTTKPRGEALLAPVLPPGGLPKVYGVEAPEGEPAPAVGKSFQ